jgi:hypothetical protein
MIRIFKKLFRKKSGQKRRQASFVPLFFLSALLLTGCGSYSGSFDCPIGEGLKCASLSEVNDKINHHDLNLDFPSKKTDASCKDCQKIWWCSDLTAPRVHYRLKGR